MGTGIGGFGLIMPERFSLAAAIALAANAERITCSQNTLICINIWG
jgi:hypothetical protein